MISVVKKHTDPANNEIEDYSESYTYDEGGQRVKAESTKETTNYVYNGLKLIYEKRVDNSGTPVKTTVKELVYALGAHQATIESTDTIDNGAEKAYYHHNDLIGTTRFVHSGNWLTVQENIVSPYGKPLLTRENLKGTGKAHMKWAGHDGINENTGLTYMQARWMDNSTGRFISMDPIKDGFNWYAYCAGNPVTYVDPTGLVGRSLPYERDVLEPTDVQDDDTSVIDVDDAGDFNFDGSMFNISGNTSNFGFGSLSGNVGGWFKPKFGIHADAPVNLKEFLLPYGWNFPMYTRDKNVQEPPRKPCMTVAQQKYDKLRAAHNGAVYAMLVERLKNEPYLGNDDSRDAYDTGNTLSEEEEFERFLTYHAYLPEYARDQMTYQDLHLHLERLYDNDREFTESQQRFSDTVRFILFGDFLQDNDVTVEGVTFMVLLGFLGADLPADIRDIIGSLDNRDYITAAITIVCLAPFIGVFKYLDEALSFSKFGKNFVEPFIKAGNQWIEQTVVKLFKKAVNSACFIAGTSVLTEEGNKPIEEIKEGDLVYAKNVKTGEVGLKIVTKTFVHKVDTIYHLYTEKEHIETTSEHPFWVVGKGFVETDELREGDILELHDGRTIKLVKMEVEHLDEPVKVYNFTVADWHTYYVGEDSVLVHNRAKKTNLAKHAIDEAVERTSKAVANMSEFFSSSKFGKSLKNQVSKTKELYHGQSVYQVTGKTGNEYLKKGDFLYLDGQHKDHLEVFSKNRKVKSVLNLDGTLNVKKTKQALEQGRTF